MLYVRSRFVGVLSQSVIAASAFVTLKRPNRAEERGKDHERYELTRHSTSKDENTYVTDENSLTFLTDADDEKEKARRRIQREIEIDRPLLSVRNNGEKIKSERECRTR
jgi:hypothetical protein